MIRRERQRLAQFRPPRVRRLARPRIDQVERDARETPPAPSPAPRSPAPRSAPAQQPQRRRIEALHADRDPVHPGIAERREAPRLDAGRIGLQRDLDVVRPASNSRRASSISAATVSGSIRLGVPPPKKIEASGRRPSRSASHASSRRSAARKRACGMRSRTCELKSQYGHLARQNGQWI